MTEELVRKTGISLDLVVFVDNVLCVVVMIIIELFLLLDIVLVILRAGIPDNVGEVSTKYTLYINLLIYYIYNISYLIYSFDESKVCCHLSLAGALYPLCRSGYLSPPVCWSLTGYLCPDWC